MQAVWLSLKQYSSAGINPLLFFDPLAACLIENESW